jgi:hypothetical protein
VDLARRLETLLVAGVVAALALLLVALLPGPRIPQVVILLVGGVLIGPEVLGWADRPAIDLLANVGERRSAKSVPRIAAPLGTTRPSASCNLAAATVDRRPNHPVGVMPAHLRVWTLTRSRWSVCSRASGRCVGERR